MVRVFARLQYPMLMEVDSGSEASVQVVGSIQYVSPNVDNAGEKLQHSDLEHTPRPLQIVQHGGGHLVLRPWSWYIPAGPDDLKLLLTKSY